MCGDPGLLTLVLLILLLAVASLPAGSVVLASALAPVAVVGGLALEYGLVDPRTVPVFGLLAVPGLILGLRTARKYPKQHLRHRLIIAVIITVTFFLSNLTIYVFKGTVSFVAGGDVPRHASLALSFLTTGKPPVFYDTLRREYRPVHYPSGLGHAAITESIVSLLFHPKDLREAASWRVQYGSTIIELVEYHVSTAMIASAIIDIILLTLGRLPILVATLVACAIYLTYPGPVPFFQSLAMLSASIVAIILNSRWISTFLILSAVVIHFYSVVVMSLLIPVLIQTRKQSTISLLLGMATGIIIQFPYVHWSAAVHFPRYPAHPNHLPPDRELGPIVYIIQFMFTAFAAYPPFIFPNASDMLYTIPFIAAVMLILIRIRKLLPQDLKIIWIMYITTIVILGVTFGRFIGKRFLFTAPLLTTLTLGFAAANYHLLALSILISYCALTTDWWYIYFINTPPIDVLEKHWKLFYNSFCKGETIATVSIGLLPFTSTWKPQKVAQVVRTFPEPGLPILVTEEENNLTLRLLPLTQVKGKYIVEKLPPTKRVWSVDDRAGSFRRNVLVAAERYDSHVLTYVAIMSYGSVPTVLVIKGKTWGASMAFMTLMEPTDDLSVFIRTRHVPNGYLVRISDWQGVRVMKITISGARWVGDKLVFHGSLRDLIANIRVTGDLV
ncbi:hypothetical protein [Methanopyrus kandleri]|uniref:Predicted membrane protein, family MK-41 family n=2 Tax=Methanopyrus kandleri TaxID=2320 RepID=Q8TYL8_METKA|nr:hypothetical protein [Methanopyrus kandleri]AAM01495.1 Predicted membrane protein, family MK-41 family [Methanopyrus kandleri AV19]HII70579.1 hypothetical protein [Methanopyrus kandleri]